MTACKNCSQESHTTLTLYPEPGTGGSDFPFCWDCATAFEWGAALISDGGTYEAEALEEPEDEEEEVEP